MQNVFDTDKMFTFMKGVAVSHKLKDTLVAINIARKKHENQQRKDGERYLIHPLTMACNAVSMGIIDDVMLAALLLHDVVEDCKTSVEELPISRETKTVVSLLTFEVEEGEDKEQAKVRYYNAIAKNKFAALCKLIDRCHNVSTMAGVFTKEKLLSYIEETRQYIIPLYRKAKDSYPEYSCELFILKYQIVSLINSIEATLNYE